MTAKLTGLEKTTTYHYRLVTTSAGGVQTGHDGTFTTADFVKDVTTGEASPLIKDEATLHGSYVGQELDTTYYFEFGTDTSYGRNVPASPADAGVESGPQEVDPIPVDNLQGETEYHYRLVMTNSLGTALGEDRSFVTPPAITDIETGEATEVGPESALLNGSFTADSHEVHYYFEWGATTSYGNKTPAPPGNAVAPGQRHGERAPGPDRRPPGRRLLPLPAGRDQLGRDDDRPGPDLQDRRTAPDQQPGDARTSPSNPPT